MTDLKEKFARILGQTPDGDVADPRPLLLKAAREFFAEEKEHLHKAHLDGAGGAAVVAGYTRLVDALVRTIHSHACQNNACADSHALIALGGFGRRELCLCSDLDITFIYEGGLDEEAQKEPGAELASLNEYVLHFLWDLGFTVGHSIRSLKESLALAGRDAAILTSMLESRLLAGDEAMFARFTDGLGDSVNSMGTNRFIRLKQRERTRCMREAGAEVYHSTPNVKLTAGGLRDYHTGVWIALARFGLKSPRELFDADLLTEEQFLKVEKALDFIWRVRNQIFLGGGSPEDTLTLSRQEHIARAFGYRASAGALAVELFMQDYYVHASELRLFLEEMLRIGGLAGSRRSKHAAPRGGKTERGLRVAHRQVYLPAKDAGWLARNPSRILEVIWYSQKHGFTPSESARKSIGKNLDLINERFREDPLAGNFFMAILSDPLRAGVSVRLMSDLGILDRYIPEFAAIRNIVRYRHFHQHPVDEHTLRALENIAMIPHLNEPGSSALKKMLSELKSPAILSLAILLHDLGKIEEDDHIEGGIRTAQAIGERLALKDELMEALLFLVSSHMEMTHISRYRDLDDPQIIRSFAASVGSVENLNMLYLLTYADLRAVRRQAWSEWIAALLYRLYLGARRALELPGDSEEGEAAYRETPKAAAVAEYLKKGDSSLVREHLTAMPPRYPTCFSPREIAEHVRMANSLKTHQNALRWVPVPDYSLSQITICTRDRPGLFAEIVGTFASQQISVLDAAVFTRTDGVAIDSFYVVDGKTDGPLTSTKWAFVRRALGKTLRGECDVESLIRRAEQNPIAARSTMSSLRKGVSFDNCASASHTIIDVEAPDRVGLLYDVASTIFGLGLDISVARIATDERQARDAFYVADREGGKIEDPLRLEEIRITIEKALDAGLIHA